MADHDPLDDARSLLALCRLLYRARSAAAATGIQPAPAAARRLVPIGVRLAAAVQAADEATTDEARAEALVLVERAGEDMAATIEDAWEGIGGLVRVLLAGLHGEAQSRPGTPPRLGP